MHYEKRFTEFCRIHDYRTTNQRIELVRAIAKLDGPFKFQTLQTTLAKKDFHVSLATIARTLRILDEAEMVVRHNEMYTVC